MNINLLLRNTWIAFIISWQHNEEIMALDKHILKYFLGIHTLLYEKKSLSFRRTH